MSKITFFHRGQYKKFKLMVAPAEHTYRDGRKKLVKSSKTVIFKDGFYATSNEDEIKAIKAHSLFGCDCSRDRIEIAEIPDAPDAPDDGDGKDGGDALTAKEIADKYLKDDLIKIAQDNDIAASKNMLEVTIAQKLIDANVKL